MVNLMLLVLIYSEGNDKKINSILNKFGVKIKTPDPLKNHDIEAFLTAWDLEE